MPVRVRYSNDKRVIAEGWRRGSPCRKIRKRVSPADREQPLFRGLPAVASATHPVVGIGKRHAADAILFRKDDGSFDRSSCIQIANTAIAIPTFDGAKT